MKRIPSFLLVALGLWACGAPAPEDTSASEDAIKNGKIDDRHTFVVGIEIEGKDGIEYCSGTLLAPNLVLTARHCFAPTLVLSSCNETFGPTIGKEKIRVNAQKSLPLAGRIGWKGVDSIVVPDDRSACGADIALLVLSGSMTAREARPAAPSFAAPKLAQSVTAIGYGRFQSDMPFSGTRRIAPSVPITCVAGSSCEESASFVAQSEFVTQGGACIGDSGGGAYLDVDGKPLVLGVVSRGRVVSCTSTIYTRLDAFQPLIVSAARKAASVGDYPLPIWAQNG